LPGAFRRHDLAIQRHIVGRQHQRLGGLRDDGLRRRHGGLRESLTAKGDGQQKSQDDARADDRTP
jgi:hypothetical protein